MRDDQTQGPDAGQGPDAASQPAKPILSRLWLPLALLAVAALGWAALGDLLSFEALARHHERLTGWRDAHYLATALGFIAAYAAVVALSLPGATVATLAGGFLFGTFPGTAFNVLAATTGAVAIFLAARWGLGARLAAGLDASEGRIARIKRGMDENQWPMLFTLRLVPVIPFFLANLLPALVGVPLRRYVVSTFLGIIPGGLVYTSVGAGLGQLFAAGEAPDLGVIFEPHILWPLIGLSALSFLPLIWKKLMKGAAL